MRYVWDPFVRIFHWSLVVAFAVAFLTHDSEWQRLTHVNAGYTAGVLILARIVWGFMKTGYASFHSFPFNPFHAARYVWQILTGSAKPFIGHNPAGSFIIYALLGAGLLTIISGYLVYNDGWLIDNAEVLQNIHFYSSWSWLGLVAIHVLGVVMESILHHDNLVSSMITGVKHHTENTQALSDDKDVSRETLHAFAKWTLGIRRLYLTYIAVNRANKKLYTIIEDNDVDGKYGVKAESESQKRTD